MVLSYWARNSTNPGPVGQRLVDHALQNASIPSHHMEMPSHVQTFEEFTEMILAWGDLNQSHVFFRDHPSIQRMDPQGGCPIQRVQLGSGACYLHAPLVLQHYLVAMGTNAPSEEPIPTMDLKGSLRVQHSLTLHDFIYKD